MELGRAKVQQTFVEFIYETIPEPCRNPWYNRPWPLIGSGEKNLLCQVREGWLFDTFPTSVNTFSHQLAMRIPFKSSGLHLDRTTFLVYAQEMCIRPAAFNITKVFSMVRTVHICSNFSIEKKD